MLVMYFRCSEVLYSIHDSTRYFWWYICWYVSKLLICCDNGGSAFWNIEQVPSRIEKLIADKQFYAAIQVYLQSSLMLEREGLQTVIS